MPRLIGGRDKALVRFIRPELAAGKTIFSKKPDVQYTRVRSVKHPVTGFGLVVDYDDVFEEPVSKPRKARNIRLSSGQTPVVLTNSSSAVTSTVIQL